MTTARYLTPALIGIALIVFSDVDAMAKEPTPVPRTHAHNDYHHKRPLLDALASGFVSVETDIFLVDGELLVAHTRFQSSPKRTLRSLYLQPLRDRIQANNGSVYGDAQQLTLLIDIKSDAESTYKALDEQLTEYQDVFAGVVNGVAKMGPVVAIISGNRASKMIEADGSRYAGIDGRLGDLASDQPAQLLPLISDNWRNHFKWRGDGAMPRTERDKLAGIITQAHAKGRRVRFWATPDRPEVWAVLRDAGADLINTDDLEGLSRFLSPGQPTDPPKHEDESSR